MSERLFWRPLARLLSRPAVAERLIAYALRTPYMHLPSDEDPSYMGRWWVFNAYDRATNVPRWAPLIPFSIRVHHIKRADNERHLHDHPWNARTIILRGWYEEERLIGQNVDIVPTEDDPVYWARLTFADVIEQATRKPGDTATLGFGQYHRISRVSDGGVWTLFISWRWRGVWGFLVDGAKVPWREYLGL